MASLPLQSQGRNIQVIAFMGTPRTCPHSSICYIPTPRKNELSTLGQTFSCFGTCYQLLNMGDWIVHLSSLGSQKESNVGTFTPRSLHLLSNAWQVHVGLSHNNVIVTLSGYTAAGKYGSWSQYDFTCKTHAGSIT